MTETQEQYRQIMDFADQAQAPLRAAAEAYRERLGGSKAQLVAAIHASNDDDERKTIRGKLFNAPAREAEASKAFLEANAAHLPDMRQGFFIGEFCRRMLDHRSPEELQVKLVLLADVMEAAVQMGDESCRIDELRHVLPKSALAALSKAGEALRALDAELPSPDSKHIVSRAFAAGNNPTGRITRRSMLGMLAGTAAVGAGAVGGGVYGFVADDTPTLAKSTAMAALCAGIMTCLANTHALALSDADATKAIRGLQRLQDQLLLADNGKER